MNTGGNALEKISNIQVGLNLDFTCFLAGFLPKSKLGKNAIYPILVYNLDFVLTRTGKIRENHNWKRDYPKS